MFPRSIEVYADTRGRSTCRYCQAPLTWAEVVGANRRVPFDGEPVALRTRHDAARRLIEEIDHDDRHDCERRP